jgi:enterochelin esterase family protein
MQMARMPKTLRSKNGAWTPGQALSQFLFSPYCVANRFLSRSRGDSSCLAPGLADSKIFKGDDATLDPTKPIRKERRIFVYVPAASVDGTQAAVLVMHDGPNLFSQVCHALDNLTRSSDPLRRLPPFIVVSVENGGGDNRGSQRGLEYDTMSDRLARFVNDEVFPAVLNRPEIRAAFSNLAITADPWGRAVMGCSSGGAAALTMGWFRPELFRRLIIYCGTFVDHQDDDAPEKAKVPLSASEYHSRMNLIGTTEKKPLRVFVHVAENDVRVRVPWATPPTPPRLHRGFTHNELVSYREKHNEANGEGNRDGDNDNFS